MKIRKKISLLLMVCVTVAGLLAGCGSRGTGNQKNTEDAASAQGGKGRFVESEVTLPDNLQVINAVGKSKEGELTLIGYDNDNGKLFLAHSKDQGKTWSQKELEKTDCYVAAVNGEDGSAAVFGYNKKSGMKRVSADGKVTKVNLQLPEYQATGKESDDMENFVTSAVYADNKLFVTDLNWVVYEVNPQTGEMSKAFSDISENVNRLIPAGTKFALMTDKGIQFADAKRGALAERMQNDDVLQQAMGKFHDSGNSDSNNIAMTMGDSGDELYYIDNDGLFYHKIGGSTTEQLINGELTSLGDRNVTFQALYKFDDKNYMVFVIDSQGARHCYRYTYDADVSAVPKNQITVYALEDFNALQQLITAYQKDHPDVMVKKTIGMSGEDGVTAEDAIRTLNTEVLAGKGPDVLVLDGLPADSYVQKGVLADLGSYVKAANEKEGLFTNITDAYTKKGKINQVPVRFYCTVVEGAQDLIDAGVNLKQLENYAGSLNSEKEKVFGNWGPQTTLGMLYDADSASWKTKTSVDQEKIRQFLKTAKALYDADSYAEKDRITDKIANGFAEGSLLGMGTSAAMSRLMGGGQIAIGSLTSINDVRQLYGMESSYKGTFTLFDAGEHKSFVPFLSLGLAQKSADNKNARAFIETALLAKGQNQMTEGFSINRTALDTECKNSQESQMGSSSSDGSYEINYEVKKISEKQQEDLTKMLESLDTPTWNDRVVRDLVLSEGQKYLQGKQSLEDTLSAIMKKVQLYEAE